MRAAVHASADLAASSSAGGEGNALLFKWALDQFSDQQENSRVFALAFMSFVGAWQEHQRITDNNKLKIRSRGEDVKRSCRRKKRKIQL